MLRTRATRLLLSTTATLGLVLGGCAGATDDGTTEDGTTTEDGDAEGGEDAAPAGDGGSVLAAAVEQSSTATTARTRFTSVVTTPEGEVRIDGEGVSGPDVAQVTMTLGGAQAAAFGAEEVEIEVRLLDGIMYQRFPQLIGQLGIDAEWLSFDLATLGPEFGSILDQAKQFDPGESLAVLQEVADVTEAGSETVNGVDTTKYEGTMTLRASMEATGVDPSTMTGSGVDVDAPLPIAVWIDGDGLVRRYEMSMDVAGTTSTTTFEVLEYDVDVDVEAPPADATVSFDELMAGMPQP